MSDPGALGLDAGDLLAGAVPGARSLRGAATAARLGGGVLIVSGALGAATWLFLVVRAQQVGFEALAGGGFGGTQDVPGPTLLDRLTLFAASVPLLLIVVLAIAAGVGIRAVAAYIQVRADVAGTVGDVPGTPAAAPNSTL